MGRIIGPHGQRLREKLTETGVTIMGNEGYGTSMHATEDLTDGGFMTEAVTNMWRDQSRWRNKCCR